MSDITIGDYWGIEKNDEGYNECGVSVAICHTDLGANLVKTQDGFLLFHISYEKAVKGNPYYERPRGKDPRHEIFEKELNSNGLRTACRKCMTLKEKIRRFIPQSLVNVLHRFDK